MGKNSLGNIAIDDISVAPGVCPSKLFTLIVFSVLTGSLRTFGLFYNKVHIFWEGYKILRNLPLTFDWHYIGQKLGEDFAKLCDLLRILIWTLWYGSKYSAYIHYVWFTYKHSICLVAQFLLLFKRYLTIMQSQLWLAANPTLWVYFECLS